MSTVTADRFGSGKGHGDENFPVASWLVARRHRAPIMAFYRFARAADDVADHPGLSGDEKLRLLDGFERTLDGRGREPAAEPLRRAIAERGLDASHARELLDAFRLDARKARHATFAELMDYCRLSAAPVGRFVLDVHGEARSLWPRSDALCAALQVNNHLQDCGRDRRELGRVYLPAELLDAAGARAEDLARPRATPALLSVIRDLAGRSQALLDRSRPFAGEVADRRLRCEVAVIQRLAERLAGDLSRRDPLAERVALRRGAVLRDTIAAVAGTAFARGAGA